MGALRTIWDEARLAAASVADFAGDLVEPTVRLGVTGLSGAGKTVFITALVHNLIAGGRLPLVDAIAEGRLKRAYLRPQPDDSVPRFDYEQHVARLLGDRVWPNSTRRISQLRLTLEFTPAGFWKRTTGGGTLNIDIVDYPGEWLLDLPLLNWNYAEWSRRTIELSRSDTRAVLARDWLAHLSTLDPAARENETAAQKASSLFKAYLAQGRDARFGLSALSPGRFLMPGDLEGSPALTFAPLDVGPGAAPKGSLWAMMERRYDSYRSVVVMPFFRDHFARLDRQIVLVDALAAINAGPAALRDLEVALVDILTCFRQGSNSLLSTILRRRIDKILFAATKADHLHRSSHDRLEGILRRLVDRAMSRASISGSAVDVAAIAAVRATREATIRRGGDMLACIVGTPVEGERIGGQIFDGKEETAIFPGELPADPGVALHHGSDAAQPEDADYRFVRFRPPPPQKGPAGVDILPHIRLDRAINFLIGDKLV